MSIRLPSTSAGYLPRRFARGLVALSTAGAFACGGPSIVGLEVGGRNQTIVAVQGQEIAVTLGNVGPATYASPPAISSSALTFLGVEVVPPYTPAGPTQRFRFRAVRAGQAIVTFRRVLGDSLVSVVEDTIRVR
ncbi:MAG TPA: hypothetical protein VF761_13385 [Gemmatimonadaceae bacterium]